MKDSPERIAFTLAHATPGWSVTITYRNGASQADRITITAPFVGVGTDVRKLRGERRYAIVDTREAGLGLVVIPFGTIFTAAPHDPAGKTDA